MDLEVAVVVVVGVVAAALERALVLAWEDSVVGQELGPVPAVGLEQAWVAALALGQEQVLVVELEQV